MSLKKEILYPIIVGVSVGIVLIIINLIVNIEPEAKPAPPAEIYYSSTSSTISAEDMNQAFGLNLRSTPNDPKLLFITNILIKNHSSKSIKELDVVANSYFFEQPDWIEFRYRTDDVILSKALSKESLDRNGTLRFNITKLGKYGIIEITIKSNKAIPFSNLDSSREDVKFTSMSIPNYTVMTASKRSYDLFFMPAAYFWLFVFGLALIAGFLTRLLMKFRKSDAE